MTEFILIFILTGVISLILHLISYTAAQQSGGKDFAAALCSCAAKLV